MAAVEVSKMKTSSVNSTNVSIDDYRRLVQNYLKLVKKIGK